MMRSFATLCLMVGLITLLSAVDTLAQDVQGDVYVEAVVDNPEPYVGQQTVYSVKLYDAVGLTNPLYQPSDFEGFWRVDIGVVAQTTEQINGRQYHVTTISTALYPTHSGSITVKPSSIVLPETVFHGKQTITSNPILLNVQSLPNGSPQDFNGAVGQFSMSATLDRQSAQVGEPIIMTVTLSGTGNVEQLPQPVVPNNWRANVNAGGYDHAIQGGQVIGKLDYQIIFMPTTIGVQELPSITLDYFDPTSVSYKSISTSAIEINVSGDTSTDFSNVSPTASEPSLKLKLISDLVPSDNKVDFLLMAVAVLVPLGAVGFLGYRQKMKDRIKDLRMKSRRQQALEVAIAHLKVVSLADSKTTYDQIDEIFNQYVADKLNVTLEKIRQADLLAFLTLNELPETTRFQFELFSSAITEGQFSPDRIITVQRRDDLIKLLRDIDAGWL